MKKELATLTKAITGIQKKEGLFRIIKSIEPKYDIFDGHRSPKIIGYTIKY